MKNLFKMIVTMPNGTTRIYWDMTAEEAELTNALIGYVTKSIVTVPQ